MTKISHQFSTLVRALTEIKRCQSKADSAVVLPVDKMTSENQTDNSYFVANGKHATGDMNSSNFS